MGEMTSNISMAKCSQQVRARNEFNKCKHVSGEPRATHQTPTHAGTEHKSNSDDEKDGKSNDGRRPTQTGPKIVYLFFLVRLSRPEDRY